MAQEYEYWTKKEEKFLINNINKMTYTELAKALGRSKDSIAGKAYREGLQKRREKRARNWTKAEVKFLVNNIDEMTTREIAKKLDRTYNSVRGKGYLLTKTGAIKKHEAKCPECNESRRIGRTGNDAYFCRNCLMEFTGNGKTLAPFEEGE